MVMQLSSPQASSTMFFADAFVQQHTGGRSTTSSSSSIQELHPSQAQHIALKKSRKFGSFLKNSAGSDDTQNNEADNDETLIAAIAMNNSTADDNGKTKSESPTTTLFMDTTAASASVSVSSSSTAQFGDVVRLGSGNPQQENSEDAAFFAPPIPLSSKPSSSSDSSSSSVASSSSSSVEEVAKSRKQKNLFVAVASVGLALMNYLYQFTHPLSTLQLLSTMQQDHAPETNLQLLGNNGKPTMVDFWAPWCENCKQMAPTLYQIQQQYGRDVNFVMVNGDDPSAWPLIEAFGVDAIPHMALVEADGTVDTALIGPVPKAWLDADLQVLIENSSTGSSTSSRQAAMAAEEMTSSEPTRARLPYQMLDVFANRPEARRLQITLKE